MTRRSARRRMRLPAPRAPPSTFPVRIFRRILRNGPTDALTRSCGCSSGTRRGDERADEFLILDPRRRLDPGCYVDDHWRNVVDRLSHVLRRKAPREDDAVAG